MKPLTKDFKKRIMENGSIHIDDVNQILKNQEIAQFLDGRESIMTYEKEAEEAKQVVKRLKKLPLEKIKMSAMIDMTNKELDDFKELQKILGEEK